MNIKLLSLLLGALCSFNTYALDNQDVYDTVRDLCAPVKTTAEGFTHFLEKTYNHPDYTEIVLPSNFAHIMQFLEHGKKTEQPLAYAQQVLRLFSDGEKRCPYINAYAFQLLLQDLPSLLAGYFLVQRTSHIHVLQDKINKLLYTRFSCECALFNSMDVAGAQTIATDLSKELSQEIYDTLNNNYGTSDISAEELRKSLLIFLEVGLSKLIWSPEDQMDTWQTVKNISEQLAALMDHNIIIDYDDLNGLFVTLLERYCFFLDIAGTELPDIFYQQIKNDIASSSLLLLTLEEQEQYIEPKIKRLQKAIERAHAKMKSTMA